MESTTTADMSQEILRTASFGQNPPKPVTSFGDNLDLPRFPSIFRLTKAGFYRDTSSEGDEVRCFACGLVLKDWHAFYDKSPIAVHLCKSPNCPHLICQNDSILDTPPPETTPAFSRPGSLQSQDVFLTEAESATVRRQLFPEDENVNKNNNNTPLTGGQIQASIKLPFKPKVGDCQMLFESKRVASFTQNPCIKAKDLAASGFIVRTRGKIVCVFCGKQTDCPTADCATPVGDIHRSLNPNCPFLRGFDLGNVSCELEDAIHRDSNDNDSDNEDTSEISVRDNPVVSPQSDLFYNPYFEDFTVRQESFQDWPPQMTPTMQQLTEAGFFYSGTFDKVTCFVCGCSLRKWQPDADALVQHAKHSPNCLYLQKLPHYHDIKQLATETQEMTSCEMPIEDGPVTNESPVKLPFPFKPSVDPTIITNCQAALASQFGFDVDLQVIRQAIAQFYAVFNSYPNFDLLVGYMLTARKEFQLLQEMRGNIHVQDRQIEQDRQQIEQDRQQIEQDRQQIQNKDQQIQNKDQQIQNKDQQIEQDRQQIQNKDQQIEQDRQQIQNKDQQIQNKDQQCMQQVSDNEQYRDQLSYKDEENLRLKQQLDQNHQLHDTQLKSKDNLLDRKTERIDQLEQDNIRMQNMIMQLRRELQVSTSRRG